MLFRYISALDDRAGFDFDQRAPIFNAKNAERLKFCEELKDEDRKGNVFRVAKQLVRKNRDVVGAGCVKDNLGKIVVEENKLLEVWKEHYDRISNEEFSWDREGLTDAKPVCGPGEKISEEVGAAIGKMKLGKAGGPSGVVADMLKAGGRYVEGCWRRGNEVDN